MKDECVMMRQKTEDSTQETVDKAARGLSRSVFCLLSPDLVTFIDPSSFILFFSGGKKC